MRFNLVFDVIDRLLRISVWERRADMHLPSRIALFGVAMTFAGLFFIILAIISSLYTLLLFTFLSFLVAAFAFLCYKFQRIYVLSENEFRYTNFLGKAKIYKFSDIQAIDVRQDTRILIMKRGKIIIESSSIISLRLKRLFNKELDRIHREEGYRRRH